MCHDANVLLRICHGANVPLWVRHDANVHVGMSWCKCPLVGMPWCKYSCRYAMIRMSAWEYVMAWMLWCKHNLFKNFLYFQNEASSAPETKIFSKLDLLFLKSQLFFDLRLLKKLVIVVRNLQMGHRFGIWWSDSKDLFSQFGWIKGVAHFQGLFLKNEFFENQMVSGAEEASFWK